VPFWRWYVCAICGVTLTACRAGATLQPPLTTSGPPAERELPKGLFAPLRRWWRRERPTGIALFLFGVRWAAWGLAAGIVLADILPDANVGREPFLLLLTLAVNLAVSFYLPLLRSRVRPFLRLEAREVDDLLVMSLADVGLALVVLHLSGGWDSPYYLYAVSALLIPSSLLGLAPNLALAAGFDLAYVAVLATSGEGTDGPWLHDEVNNFLVFLSVPVLVAIVVQFFGWLARQLNEEREIARAALEENIRLQKEREQIAAEHERSRIAREIHDGIAQLIYMLSLNLEAAAETATREPALGARLHQLVSMAKQALLEVRHYIFDLKPLLSGDTTLAGALQGQIREFTAVSGLPVDLEVTGRDRPLEPAVTTALYRVAQESLANVFRHADASRASVSLVIDDRSVTLKVADNGAGFDSSRDEGRGLDSMKQRIAELAGTLTIDSTPGKGTRVTAIIAVEDQ